jgi:hypothetical protein
MFILNAVLPDSWIKSIWEFASINRIEIQEDVTEDLHLHCHNDQYIMMKILQLNKYKKKDLEHINMCQKHCLTSILSFRHHIRQWKTIYE